MAEIGHDPMASSRSHLQRIPCRTPFQMSNFRSRSQSIRDHRTLGIDVLLFVRPRSKTREGKAAPFTYCGPVDFVSWDGDRPITVKWRLREAVPERLWEELRVP